MPACLCRQLAARIVPGRLSWLVGVKAASVEARRVAASLVDSLEGDHEAACPAVACLAAACPAAAYPAVAFRGAASQAGPANSNCFVFQTTEGKLHAGRLTIAGPGSSIFETMFHI